MSPSLNLPIGSAVSINSTDLTEHNRKPISISNSIIDKSERMANGLMRTFFIANKRTINLSWEKIPSTSAMTVDGKAGAMDMRSLYYSLAGSAISLNIKRNNSQTEQIVCVFQSANFDLLNRNIRNVISQPTIIKITSATGSNGNIIYGYSGGSPVAGDKVDVRGFDSEQFNVNQALISSVSNGTFTVPSQKALQSSVTAAVSSNGTITYYSNNSFTPGDIVSISGLKTATITGATVGSNNVLFNCSNPPYAVGDVINITGVSPDVFNVSNSTVTEVLTNGFVATAPGIQSVAYVSGGTASSVFNLANVAEFITVK